MQHIPILRACKPYYSLNTKVIPDFRTGDPFVEVSQANRGLIAKDYANATENQAALRAHSTETLLGICEKAADIFESHELPLGEGSQTPEAYILSLIHI